MQNELHFIQPNNACSAPLIAIFGKDSENRILLSTLMDIWKYRTVEVANEQELAQVIELENPNLVLLDLSYSFSEELAAMRRMKKANPHKNTPFIVLSGHVRPEYSSFAMTMGATDYLIKPLDFERLGNSVKKYACGDNTENFLGINYEQYIVSRAA
jgi:two-component system response regulator AtoC